MCCGCWNECGSPHVVNDKVLAAHALVQKVYEHNAAGGCGHIVFDDFNVGDDSIEFCLKYLAERREIGDVQEDEHAATHAALVAFQELTEDERASVLAIGYGCFDPMLYMVLREAAQ